VETDSKRRAAGGRRTRHVLTLGDVGASVAEAAAGAWRAEKVDGDVDDADVVVLVADHGTTAPADYVATLQRLDRARIPFAVLPVWAPTADPRRIAALLGQDKLPIDFATARFRMPTCDGAAAPDAPAVLRSSPRDDPESASGDLRDADLLCLQGHAGPVDGGFGAWLYLCSRHLHQPGTTPFFPCFGTDRCFRQEYFGRPPTSDAGLVDPRTIAASLLLVDGCSTLPLPGSLFPYATSLARSVMESRAGAAVMTHGFSDLPLSALIVFLTGLAGGRTLGEAVREANEHGHDALVVASIRATGAAPWTLIGNPDATVTGLPLLERAAEARPHGVHVALDDVPERTGALVSVPELPAADHGFDVTCSDGRWARGALRSGGGACLWVAGGGGPVEVTLVPRPADATGPWRRAFASLHVGRGWLEALADRVAARHGDDAELRSLAELFGEVQRAAEDLAASPVPRRRGAIEPPLAATAADVSAALERLDRATAVAVARGIAAARTRTFGLWSPPLLDTGFVDVGETCLCGAPLAAHGFRHPILDASRLQLDCPGCGPAGDVAADRAADDGALVPGVVGLPPTRHARRGETLVLPARRPAAGGAIGAACPALVDQFHERGVVSEAVALPPACELELTLPIPADWPEGLAQVVTVVSIAGELSFLDFDVLVSG
jgi:hypothetical protein